MQEDGADVRVLGGPGARALLARVANVLQGSVRGCIVAVIRDAARRGRHELLALLVGARRQRKHHARGQEDIEEERADGRSAEKSRKRGRSGH